MMIDINGCSREKAIFKVQKVAPRLFPGQTDKDAKSILRSMYNHTQKALQDAGYGENDYITLYRGFGIKSVSSKFVGSKVSIHDNPISSWSAESYVARNFANQNRRSTTDAIVVKMEIPRKRVLSAASTGFGCWSESEFTILGGKNDQGVLVYKDD